MARTSDARLRHNGKVVPRLFTLKGPSQFPGLFGPGEWERGVPFQRPFYPPFSFGKDLGMTTNFANADKRDATGRFWPWEDRDDTQLSFQCSAAG